MNSLDFSKFDTVGEIKYRDYDGNVKTINPKKALAFSSSQIPFETQAITYYTVGQIMERANLNLESAKFALRKLHSQLYLRFTVDPDLVKANKGKKPTDSMINSRIDLEKNYSDLELKVNELQMKYNLLKDLFKAFEQRKDLMQSISAQKRAEANITPNTAYDSIPQDTKPSTTESNELGPEDFGF